MKRGVLGRADLMLALANAPAGAEAQIAALLGFEGHAPSQPQPKPPPAERVTTTPDQQEAPSFTAGPIMPVAFWRPEQFSERPEKPRPTPPLHRPVWRNAPLTPPVFHALAPWPELEVRLHQAISPGLRSGGIDIQATVQELSRLRHVPHLPRERTQRWPRQIQVIVDRSRHLWPYARDQTLVSNALRGLVPSDQLSFALCHDAAAEPRTLDHSTGDLSPYVAPDPETVVLVLGDLGCLDAGDPTSPERWSAFGHRLAALGCSPVALLPCAAHRCDDRLRGTWTILPWERADPTGAVHEGAADQLLMLVSPAVRIEPGLLRAVRRNLLRGVADAGVESEVWQHPAIISDDPRAATLNPDVARDLRSRFELQDQEVQRRLLHLLTSWRHGLKHEIWFEEVASLSKGAHALLREPEDAKDAETFFTWQASGSLADSTPTRDWLLRVAGRATRHGWSLASLAETLIAVKGERFAPPGWVSVDAFPSTGPPEQIEVRQFGADAAARPSGDADAGGSLLGVLRSSNGRCEIEADPRDAFWSTGSPPSWASDWGTDEYGHWVAFRVPGPAGSPVVEPRLRWCPPGAFLMGSPESEWGRWDDEGPRYEVTLRAGFWMFEQPCTQGLWSTVMGDDPSRFKDPGRPVETVSFEDIQRFLARINAMVPGLDLELPSEARWEYACRAGTMTAFSCGDDESTLGDFAWFSGNSEGTAHPVGAKQPNAWGLHDMHGNVREWCSDWQSGNLQGGFDPVGPATGSDRVSRGGSWRDQPILCRSAYRGLSDSASRSVGNDSWYRSIPHRSVNLGFRVARSPAGR